MNNQQAATSNFHDTRHNYLSYSQLADFQACPYRWSLRYFRGLRPKATARPLALGDAVHQCIANWLINQNRDSAEAIQEAMDHWVETNTPDDFYNTEKEEEFYEIIAIAPQLAAMLAENIKERGWQTLNINGKPSVELDLQTQIGNGFDAFIGHLDWLCWDPNSNLIRLVDFKVRRTFMPQEAEETNLQQAVYQELCRRNGIPVAGTVTFEVRNSVPSSPKLNKNGTMSRTAIQTDWPTYRSALVDAGLDPAGYADMEEKLAGYQFTNPLHSYRTPEETRRIWDTVVLPVAGQINELKTTLRADNAHEPVRVLKHLTCQSCQFRTVCLQSLSGYDIGPVLTSLFDVMEESK